MTTKYVSVDKRRHKNREKERAGNLIKSLKQRQQRDQDNMTMTASMQSSSKMVNLPKKACCATYKSLKLPSAEYVAVLHHGEKSIQSQNKRRRYARRGSKCASMLAIAAAQSFFERNFHENEQNVGDDHFQRRESACSKSQSTMIGRAPLIQKTDEEKKQLALNILTEALDISC